MTDKPYPAVEPQADFPALEQRVLDRWDKEQTFERSIEQRPAGDDGENEFVFTAPASEEPAILMHEIVDFKPTDLIRMSKYDIFETVVLTDVIEGKPEGLALDLNQSRWVEGFETKVVGQTTGPGGRASACPAARWPAPASSLATRLRVARIAAPS